MTGQDHTVAKGAYQSTPEREPASQTVDRTPGGVFSPGDTALVFDGDDWRRFGDVGDNSQFWKPCELLRVYRNDRGDVLAIVRWPTGRTSGGHFVSAMREMTPASEVSS